MHSSPSPLQRSLLAALAYFDLFDYPLTLSELCRFRYGSEATSGGQPHDSGRSSLIAHRSPLGIHDVLQALAGIPAGERDGFYFLDGREKVADIRQRRYRLAEGKFAKARRAARFLGLLPSVRLVAVCNSLAISNADTESDIDLFVVCRPGTLWSTRMIVVGSLHLLGLRPKSGFHADTFCLSFFLSEDRLDLSGLALRPEDTYLRYWIATLVPLYDAGGVMDAFRAANSWIEDRLPAVAKRRSSEEAKDTTPLRLSASPLLERWAKRFQQKRFPADIQTMANKDSRVVIADDILKFHTNDRRAYFEGRFREKLRELGIQAQSEEREAKSEQLARRSSLVAHRSLV